MNVLFVGRGKKNSMVSSILLNQGLSLRKLGINVEFFPIQGKGFFGYLISIPMLRKRIRDESYQVIHAHYGLAGIISLIAKKHEPLIVSFMGDDIVGSNNSNGTITLVSRIIAKMNIFISKRFYNHSIVKSFEMLNAFSNFHRVSLIANGVDLIKFHPIPIVDARRFLNLDQDIEILLFIGNPSRVEKNYSLASLSHTLLYSKNTELIQIHGIDHNRLVYYYNAADVLLLASFHEGSPNVVKEAMACNCPIVSTDVGDVRELFGSVDGYYIAEFNPKDFSEKIKKAIAFRSKNGYTKGRFQINNLNLDAHNVALKIEGIYNKVVVNHKE